MLWAIFQRIKQTYKDGRDALEIMMLLSVCHKMSDGKNDHNKFNVKKNLRPFMKRSFIYYLDETI